MSAKQAYAQPTNSLPELPPEIWLEILQTATWLPEFSKAEDAHIDYLLAPYRKVYKQLWPVLATRNSLTRVCKTWNIWSTPFLYENIFIGRGRVLSSLLDALRGPTTDTGAHGEPHFACDRPGRYTKRLDIALRSYSTPPVSGDEESHEDWEHLASIINLLPNVKTIKFLMSTAFQVQIPTQIMQNIAMTCGPSLQVLDWHPPSPSPCLVDLAGLLRRTPNLRVLRATPGLHTPEPYTEWDSLAETPITLPHLTELSADWIYLGIDRRFRIPDPPPLKHLILKDNHWVHFVKIYGSTLTRLSIMPLRKRIDGALTSFTPNLVHLDIRVQSWASFPENLAIPPTCTHFGISSRTNQGEDYIYRILVDRLNKLGGKVLQVLIFLNDRDIHDLGQRHRKRLTEIIDIMKERGVCVEDGHGQALARLV